MIKYKYQYLYRYKYLYETYLPDSFDLNGKGSSHWPKWYPHINFLPDSHALHVIRKICKHIFSLQVSPVVLPNNDSSFFYTGPNLR